MKYVWAGAIAATLLAACGGGNPFVDDSTTPTTPGTGSSAVPAAVEGNLGTFTFNTTTGVLTIEGVALEADALNATYVRKPALDRGGYLAYTSQEDGLSRHSTAYVRDINGTRALVVMTGPQAGSVFGGASYSRAGAYDPVGSNVTPNGGLVTYLGNYVGLLNGSGSSEDLITPPPGTPPSLAPGQAAEITGFVLLNADFTDNKVNGRITNRNIPDFGGVTPEDIDLAPTDILADGTFTGTVEQNNNARGTYGGIFGGVESAQVAGGLFVEDHISQLSDEEERGIFVLVQCGQPGDDPLCP
ncbi:hypothetical protein [Aestuariivita boseongensis]|uniref:hypothetical protein n=1 Tax=Aestuariivita boseongensis TaxID=1470562 RepID=UPI000681A2D5|nr:hypothetical protein [Aestuariivita boseongensis]